MSESRRKPLIGVTGSAKRFDWGRIAACAWIRRAGGRALPLAPGRQGPVSAISGLVVSGGTDLDPALYLTSGGPWVAADPERDGFELTALDAAQKRTLPVLGICRGAQLINVVAGGTLYSDITSLRRVTSNRPTLRPSKVVDIEPGSRLRRTLGADVVHVNSLHHQAIDRLGGSLRVVARDRDQIVQGIESSDERFLVGVQWHPEYLPWKPEQRRIFRALVEAAREIER